MTKGRITIQIDDNLRKDFKSFAAQHDKTMSEILERFIADLCGDNSLSGGSDERELITSWYARNGRNW